MTMGGGGTMSTAWMPMPGQTWPAAAATFLGMWTVMMVAMMLPSFVPMLWRYRQAIAGGSTARRASLTAIVAAGYFAVWSGFGVAAYPLGAAVATIAMRQPEVARLLPLAACLVVVTAGALQFTAWKARHLACCRGAPGPGRTMRGDAATAWAHGLRLGLHCAACCGGLMAILLVCGVMDVRVMALVTAAITLERLAPAGERTARAVGAAVVAVGLLLVMRAVGMT